MKISFKGFWLTVVLSACAGELAFAETNEPGSNPKLDTYLAQMKNDQQEHPTLKIRAQAPDFALPDLADRVHRLSDYRGRKVLLVTWASW